MMQTACTTAAILLAVTPRAAPDPVAAAVRNPRRSSSPFLHCRLVRLAPLALFGTLLAGVAPAAEAPLSRIDEAPQLDAADPSAPGLKARPKQPMAQAAKSSAKTATIRGRVFYNDRRLHGLFAERYDKQGNRGQRCKPSGKRDDGSSCAVNWLGGRYIVVDVIERDSGFLPTDFNCKKEDILTSATVGRDGSFAATISTDDPCKHDKLAGTAVELRMRLRFCGADFCFSLNDKKNNPYVVSSANASADNPMTVWTGNDVTVPDMHFSTSGDAAVPNNNSIAANYYASVVDTILWLHKDNPLPFYKEEFGEVQFVFPSTKTKSATTRAPDEVVISNSSSQPNGTAFAWVNGDVVAHEYGHVLNLRAWDGSYGFDGIGKSAVNTKKADSQQLAFKEGWAGFINRAVFQPTYGCDDPKFDDNGSTALIGPLGEGTWWRGNIIKALCDWYDKRDDGGDGFEAEDIYSMWYNLRRMYVDRAKYGGEFKQPGLWFCDYVNYYLDVRKSVAEVGRASHDSYVGKISDLIYHNNIGCFLPRSS